MQDSELDFKGLTSEEVNEQIRLGHVNTAVDTDTTTVKDIVLKNTFTYFNYIYVALSILVIIVGSFRSLTFLGAVIINTLIGTLQEIYAKNTLDKLSVLNMARYPVLRDGELTSEPSDALVLGDAVLLKTGVQIPADAEIISGHIRVNEALLTGEEDEIDKDEGDSLLSGSFVVSGECYAVLTKVGEDSYASKLVLKARELSTEAESEMVADINLIIKVAGIIIIPVGIGLFARGYFISGESFHDSILSMVAAVVGMVPQGLVLLFSAALALSAARLANRGVMLHDMKSVETLARIDVFCVDKTGTITENSMKVEDVIITRSGPNAEKKVSMLIGAYLSVMPDNNSTIEALRERFTGAGSLNAIKIEPFSSSKKYSMVMTDKEEFRLGAPDILLDAGPYGAYEDTIESYEKRGLRVMAFVRIAEGSTELLALMALENPIREDAAETFEYLQDQGVKIMVISGDNPITVSNLATRVGIEGADKYINASEIKNDSELIAAVKNKVVFGRTSPEQKRRIIEILKRDGHKVAMTGDGVNDILAMKNADCSISMGTGSDAARQASQIVLLDSAFSKMKDIIGEGRKDINNMERSATLFLVKNIFSLLLAIFAIFTLSSYPLEPSQISLINSFNIGIPAALLALEHSNRRQEGRFLYKVLFKSLPAALTAFIVIAGMSKLGEIFKLPDDDISVACTFLLAVVTFMILVQIVQPMNRYRIAVIIICPIGLILLAAKLPWLFAITRMAGRSIVLFLVFAVAAEPILRVLTRLFNDASQSKRKRQRRREIKENRKGTK